MMLAQIIREQSFAASLAETRSYIRTYCKRGPRLYPDLRLVSCSTVSHTH